MKMTKKLAMAAIAATMTAALAVGGTLMFLSATSNTALNTVTVGYVDVEVDEVWTAPATPIIPGTKLDKTPTVKNTGSVPAWIRVAIDDDTDFNILDLNAADWIDGGDGYYYYKNIVSNVETDGLNITAPLFTKVQVGESVEGTANQSLNISIYAEAIQDMIVSDGNGGTDWATAVYPDGGTAAAGAKAAFAAFTGTIAPYAGQ